MFAPHALRAWVAGFLVAWHPGAIAASPVKLSPAPVATASAVAAGVATGPRTVTLPQRRHRYVPPKPAQDANPGIGGARRIFGSAKMRLSRSDQGEAFDPVEFQAKLDQLTAKTTARRLGRRELQSQLIDEAQVQGWFETCDRDRNGWLALGEAAVSMSFDRNRFQAFDEDRDGRLDPYEFDDVVMHAILSVGRFAPPRHAPPSPAAPTRTPEQMRNAYDSNLDRALDGLELAQVLADYDRRALSPERVVETLDGSGDGRLDAGELGGLNALLYPVEVDEAAGAADEAPARTIEDLFGQVVQRGESGSVLGPPLIVGPVGHFRRLDLDGDGYISVQDLDTLLRPVRSSIRPLTVINTLDRDGDSRLDEREFLGCLHGSAR